MFSKLRDGLAKAFKAGPSTEEDVVYFGGIEPSTPQIPANGLMFAVYVPMNGGLVYLPYLAFEEDVIHQILDMEVGEGFCITNEDTRGGIGGELLQLQRTEPREFIRIVGLETNHPEARPVPILKL